MKKIVAFMIIFCLSLPLVCFAQTTAEILPLVQIVRIEGQLTQGYVPDKGVTILLRKKGAAETDTNFAGYVNQIAVEADGSYQHEFTFTQDIDNYELAVYDGQKDITSTVEIAKCSTERLVQSNISIEALQNADGEVVTVVKASLSNTTNGDIRYVVVAAEYDEDGRLIKTTATEEKILCAGASDVQETLTLSVKDVLIKCFIWESCESMIPISKEKTSYKPFVAYAWYQPEIGADNVYQMFYVGGHNNATRPDDPENAMCNLSKETPQEAAEKMKLFMEGKPEGGRVIMPIMSRLISDPDLDGKNIFDNWFWWEKGINKNIEYLCALLSAYQEIDGPDIDAFVLDYEIGCDRYNMAWGSIGGSQQVTDTQMEAMLANVISDPRYSTDVRPGLAAMGFTFYIGDDHNELYYYGKKPISTSTEEHRTSFYKGLLYAAKRKSDYLNQIYDAVKTYYPNASFTNYGSANMESNENTFETVPLQNYQADIPWSERTATPVGTHAAPVLYGAVPTTVSNNPPSGYSYSTFKKTPFNGALAVLQKVRDVIIYSENSKIQPWIGNRTWDYNDNVWFASTEYYKELILHIGLHNAEQMLAFNNAAHSEAWAHDDILLSELLKELTEVAGYSNRKCISSTAVDINKRYLLTGMYVNGKNVWRITPDIYTPDENGGHVTKNSFLADSEQLTFRIGNQIVQFPEGSYLYEAENEQSSIGYWVVSPAGTSPEEFISSAYDAPPESDYVFIADAEYNRLKEELTD